VAIKLPRIVLDTNIIVSASWGGAPGEIIQAWFSQRYALLISPPILAEYQATLERLLPNSSDASHFLHAVYLRGITVTPREKVTVIKQDPDDNRFLECALAGHADYIVSGDQHLLKLGSFRKTPIVTPRAFLNRLK
jgi:uncharacterized protein